MRLDVVERALTLPGDGVRAQDVNRLLGNTRRSHHDTRRVDHRNHADLAVILRRLDRVLVAVLLEGVEQACMAPLGVVRVLVVGLGARLSPRLELVGVPADRVALRAIRAHHGLHVDGVVLPEALAERQIRHRVVAQRLLRDVPGVRVRHRHRLGLVGARPQVVVEELAEDGPAEALEDALLHRRAVLRLVDLEEVDGQIEDGLLVAIGLRDPLEPRPERAKVEAALKVVQAVERSVNRGHFERKERKERKEGSKKESVDCCVTQQSTIVRKAFQFFPNHNGAP